MHDAIETRMREALLPFAGAMPMERFEAMVAAAVRAAVAERGPEVVRFGGLTEPTVPHWVPISSREGRWELPNKDSL